MECVLHVLLRVMMRRSICRLQEVVDMAVEVGTALFVAVRVSGLISRRPAAAASSSSISATTYFYSSAAASVIGMSRIDRH
ncbi:hypothetical protein HU200_067408 [Digitaria exilis]|uniref:Uncharacterized protein n=1 Tax=Digitaria exilis TaxID=1010633 RepID=A0A834ZZN0_9POAL|nr:hypothetical protein HU200_067408 [Digitaria exilis]